MIVKESRAMITKTFKSKEQGLREFWLETADGWCIYPEQNGRFLQYGHRFNMNTLEETDDENYPTYNQLVEQGLLVEKKCFNECDIQMGLENCDEFHKMSKREKAEYVDELIKTVVASFARKGYCVTETAISHNFNAWSEDRKSGYRDEDNGYHLFTPCGCNMLQFRLSTLSSLCEDWQITYEA